MLRRKHSARPACQRVHISSMASNCVRIRAVRAEGLAETHPALGALRALLWPGIRATGSASGEVHRLPTWAVVVGRLGVHRT